MSAVECASINLFENLVGEHCTNEQYICDRIGKTDHIVTIDISRNTYLKYRSRHGSLVLDCSHARFAVYVTQEIEFNLKDSDSKNC